MWAKIVMIVLFGLPVSLLLFMIVAVVIEQFDDKKKE